MGALNMGTEEGERKKDSGLLYFAVGNHGADYGAWMRSQEFQIQEGDCGDYWGVAGGMGRCYGNKKSRQRICGTILRDNYILSAQPVKWEDVA